MHFMMSSTHTLCAVHIFYDVQDTLLWPVYIFYVHFTCFIFSTHILCAVHILYDFQYTSFMSNTHILCPVHILFAVHVVYVRYTFYDVQYTRFVSSTHNFVIAVQQSDPNAQNCFAVHTLLNFLYLRPQTLLFCMNLWWIDPCVCVCVCVVTHKRVSVDTQYSQQHFTH